MHIPGMNPTETIDGHFADFETKSFQRFGCVQNRVMFNGRYDQMPAPAHAFESNALECQVVRFCTAGSKNNFFGFRSQQQRNLFAAAKQRILRRLAVMVQACRIAEVLPQERQHGGENLGGDRGTGNVVQVSA